MNKSNNIYPVNLITEHDIKSENNHLVKSKSSDSIILDGQNTIEISIKIDSNDYPISILRKSLKKAFDSILAKYY